LASCEGSVFVTSVVHDDLSGTQWYRRLRPVALERRNAHLPGVDIYRLFDTLAR
jgi:hypothetical protein